MTDETGKARVHVIEPNGVYFLDQAKRLLRLRDSTIRRELRLGHMRVAKRAGRYYILGRWLIEWIEGGEVRRGKASPDTEGRK